MASSNQQFNFNFESFLFEQTNKMSSETYNSKIWNEIDVAALRKPSDISQNNFSAFIGEITPADAAVLGESPLIDTPYLDTSISTPFTPSSAFTPSLVNFQNSPYIGVSAYNGGGFSNTELQDDVQVAKYLKNERSWQDLSNTAIPAINVQPFNGDIPFLAIEQNSNSLFPPLPSDNCTDIYINSSNHETNIFSNNDIDILIPFDIDFSKDDYYIDDTTYTSIHSNHVNTTSTDVVQPTLNKRKMQDNTLNNYDSKPAKRRITKSSTTLNTLRHECHICAMRFTRRYNLSSHMKTHDPNRYRPFPCNLCKKQFDRKHDLTRHVSTVHNGERAFNCSKCCCTFSRKDALNRHSSKKHSLIEA